MTPSLNPLRRQIALSDQSQPPRSRRSWPLALDQVQEVRKQAWLSAPLAADLMMTHGLTLVSLAWAAQLGTLPLAVAALGAASYTMLGRLSISGICGALDTQAAQVRPVFTCVACKSVASAIFSPVWSRLGARKALKTAACGSARDVPDSLSTSLVSPGCYAMRFHATRHHIGYLMAL